MIILIVIGFLMLVVGVCLTILLYANDFSLPELDLSKYKKQNKPLTIVAIFPHPDDETMAAGGTLAKYAAMPDTWVVIISVTSGDQGETGGLCEPSELAAVRKQELADAAKAMGVKEAVAWDFPDGNLGTKVVELEERLTSEFTRLDADVVITYDNSGLYGHPDHIVLSMAVQKVVHAKFPQVKLLFTTLPAKLLKNINLPETITLSDRVIKLDKKSLTHSLPKYRSSFWNSRGSKINAMRAHRTQNIAKHLPVPLAVYSLIGWVEYFSED